MCSKRVFNAKPNPTRDAIAESALRLFAEQGVENTTMRQIVDAAGISLGTVNFHYGSKLGLAQEVLERLAKDVRDARIAEYEALEARPLATIRSIWKICFAPSSVPTWRVRNMRACSSSTFCINCGLRACVGRS